MDENKNNPTLDAIQLMCQYKTGAIDTRFLCRSLSMITPALPVTVNETTKLREVLDLLKRMKGGCVIVENPTNKLAGIFSERDMVLKVYPCSEKELDEPVLKYMTKDPVTATLDTTLAYAINLMSQGGFRHLPLVDADNNPVGMISVKDILDALMESFMEDLMNFPVGEGEGEVGQA